MCYDIVYCAGMRWLCASPFPPRRQHCSGSLARCGHRDHYELKGRKTTMSDEIDLTAYEGNEPDQH
jgi:hypothetical protein